MEIGFGEGSWEKMRCKKMRLALDYCLPKGLL
jgi:hypothetical protein